MWLRRGRNVVLRRGAVWAQCALGRCSRLRKVRGVGLC